MTCYLILLTNKIRHWFFEDVKLIFVGKFFSSLFLESVRRD